MSASEEQPPEGTATQSPEQQVEARVRSDADAPPSLQGYQLESLQGRGSFGEVWSGVQLRSGQRVAVKLFLAADRAHWSYFHAEVERLCQVAEHPNVVSLLDADLTCEPPYFVMNLYPGSLANWQKSQTGSVDPRPVLIWLEQVARALRHTHQRGLLHCDLKPSNVLLDIEQQAHLADFGQAILRDTESRSLGTLGFMAPEQSEPRAAPDIRWDVYALGATAYFLLSGQRPRLDEQTLRSVTSSNYRACLQERLRPLRELNPRVDRDLAHLLEACLELEPSRRPEGMGEVLEDLERRRQKRPLLCRRPWTPAYLLKRALRRHALVSLFATLLLGVLCTAGWVFWGQFQSTVGMLAQQEFRQGWNLDEQGESAEALLWWAEAVRLAPGRAGYRRPLRDYPFALQHVWRHNEHLEHLVFSRDGNRLLAGSDDGSAQVWEVASGERVAEVRATAESPEKGTVHFWDMETNLQSADLAPDGTFVTAAKHGPVRLWDRSGHLLRSLAPGSQAAFSSDGSKLLILSDQVLRVVDLAGGQETFALREPQAGARFSPDGRLLVSWGGSQARLWDLTRGGPPRVLGHGAAIHCANFDDSSQRLTTASEDRTVAVWSLEGRRLLRISTPEPANVSSFSHDGSRLAIVGNLGSLGVWDVVDGHPLFAPRRQRWAMLGAAFTPDDRRLLTYSYYGVARLWEAGSGHPGSPSFLTDGPLKAACLSPDGHLLATGGGDGTVRLWQLGQSGPHFEREVMLDSGDSHPENLRTRVNLSPDGRMLVSYREDGVCRVWDTSSGRPLTRVLQAQPQKDAPMSAGFSGDGRWIVLGGVRPQVYQVDTGAERGPALPLSQAGYNFMALDQQGRRLVTLELDNQLRSWDVASGQPAAPPITTPVPLTCIFSPDGQYLAVGSFDQTVRILDLASGQLTSSFKHGMFSGSIAYNPGGTRLISGSGDGTARIWRIQDGQATSLPMPHTAAVIGTAFSPSGQLAATVSLDGLARLWDHTGEPVVHPLPHPYLISARFSADGRSLISASSDRVRFWDATLDADEPPDHVRARVEVLTGMELRGSRGGFELSLQKGWPRLSLNGPAPTLTPLSAQDWEERRNSLR